MLLKLFHKYFRQFGNAGLVVRISDIDDFPVAQVVLVLNDPEEAFYSVRKIREASFLVSAVNEEYGSAFDQVQYCLLYTSDAADE